MSHNVFNIVRRISLGGTIVKVGYARTSTLEQEAGFQAQLKRLKEAGCEKLFKEQVSSVGERAQLHAALEYIRDSDILVVTKLDRLARSTSDLLRINEAVERKGARLRILDLDLDTSTATGKLLLTMVGAIAAFERDLMLERQREGIAAAKAAGKYKGRKATAKAKTDEARALKKQGLGASEIARRLGIGRASVYRVLQQP
jgi:DNA invertase Pin-like site-specific DNA recombinase